MARSFFRSPALLWLVLVAATLASYVSTVEGAGGDARIAGSIVLVIAFFKVRLIGLGYMELGHAPLPLRFVFEAWVVAIALVLLVLFWQVA